MKVLVATKNSQVLASLNQRQDADLETFAALDTGRIYKVLPECQAAIVDENDLIKNPFAPRLVSRLVQMSNIKFCTSAAFLDDPEEILKEENLRRSTLALPEKKVIAFTSYSGGTGKTTLALGTAAHFCRVTRRALALPAAVFEFSYGASAIQAILGSEYADLDKLIAQGDNDELHDFHGVSLFPLNHAWRSGQGDVPGDVRDYIRAQADSHVLTVIDTKWPHAYSRVLHEQVDLWIIVAVPRVDAVDNARILRQTLSQRYGEDKVVVAINKAGGFTSQLALMGMEREIELPQVKPSELISSGKLGKTVLGYVYGESWQRYEKLGVRRGLFRRRGRD